MDGFFAMIRLKTVIILHVFVSFAQCKKFLCESASNVLNTFSVIEESHLATTFMSFFCVNLVDNKAFLMMILLTQSLATFERRGWSCFHISRSYLGLPCGGNAWRRCHSQQSPHHLLLNRRVHWWTCHSPRRYKIDQICKSDIFIIPSKHTTRVCKWAWSN